MHPETLNPNPWQSGNEQPLPAAPPADQASLARLDEALERIESLSSLLSVEEDYAVAGLEYQWPAKLRLSVIIPVFNEELTLHRILCRVDALPIPKEIIVVDDCSTDRTAELLGPLEQTIRIIRKPINEGKGAALRDGFAAATGDIVVIQDADLEYDPRDIPRVVEPIVRGEADVVFGSRFLADRHQDPSWLHRFGNRLLTNASNLFTGLKLTDMETCYKAFRRAALNDITLRQNRFGFEPEITARLARRGYRFTEVPIAYRARSYAEGKKIRLRDALNAIYCIVRYGLWP